MGNRTNPKSYSARERLVFIERLAYWRGWVRRADVVSRFGVSVPQASADIAAYLEVNPEALIYDASAKRYLGSMDMQCTLGKPLLTEGLALLRGGIAAVSTAHIDLPTRSARNSITRDVLRACAANTSVAIYYYSVNSNRERWRTVVPRAFANDGYRWHVRAWCSEDRIYKDFVLGRIAKTRPSDESIVPPDDEDWDAFVTVRFRPHRALGAAQRKAIERDFRMKDGVLVMKVRKAMLAYTLAYLRVESDEPLRLLEIFH